MIFLHDQSCLLLLLAGCSILSPLNCLSRQGCISNMVKRQIWGIYMVARFLRSLSCQFQFWYAISKWDVLSWTCDLWENLILVCKRHRLFSRPYIRGYILKGDVYSSSLFRCQGVDDRYGRSILVGRGYQVYHIDFSPISATAAFGLPFVWTPPAVHPFHLPWMAAKTPYHKSMLYTNLLTYSFYSSIFTSLPIVLFCYLYVFFLFI